MQGAPGWEHSPRSLAAHIILLDQFSRHIYRSSSTYSGNGGQIQGMSGEECKAVIEVNGRKALEMTKLLLQTNRIV